MAFQSKSETFLRFRIPNLEHLIPVYILPVNKYLLSITSALSQRWHEKTICQISEYLSPACYLQSCPGPGRALLSPSRPPEMRSKYWEEREECCQCWQWDGTLVMINGCLGVMTIRRDQEQKEIQARDNQVLTLCREKPLSIVYQSPM